MASPLVVRPISSPVAVEEDPTTIATTVLPVSTVECFVNTPMSPGGKDFNLTRIRDSDGFLAWRFTASGRLCLVMLRCATLIRCSLSRIPETSRKDGVHLRAVDGRLAEVGSRCDISIDWEKRFNCHRINE